MTLRTPFSATAAVTNVLNGKTADGTTPLSRPIPFTNNRQARCAAISTLQTILLQCRQAFTSDDITPFTVKWLSHLTKAGLQNRAAILSFNTAPVIAAITANPTLLSSKAGISAMLRDHRRRRLQARAQLMHNLANKVPQRRLIWSSPPYTLEEATDPRHLQHDSLVLGHCIGTLHLTHALRHRNLTPDDPQAIHYLRYWVRIKTGESRIFTLMHNGLPAFTIEASPAARTIVHIQGAPGATPPPLLAIAIAAVLRAMPPAYK